MKKKYRRVAPPASLDEAAVRWGTAAACVKHLKRARDQARTFPATRAYICRVLKSAEGALRHAERIYFEMAAKEVGFGKVRGIGPWDYSPTSPRRLR